MRNFFIVYKRPQEQETKGPISATNAAAALHNVGWPQTRVFGLIQYMTYDEVEQALANNPAGAPLKFDEWEAKYGSAKSPDFLWVQPGMEFPRQEFHPALNGANLMLCALTGHVRYKSIPERYGAWTPPRSSNVVAQLSA